MSLIIKELVDCGTYLGVWKKEEKISALLDVFPLKQEELTDFERITNLARKEEWMISRILLTELAEQRVTILYSDFGKPYLNKPDVKISISHSKNFVAALLSFKSQVGIDVEQINHRAAKVRHKFLTEIEQEWCKSDFDHTLVWSAKEAVFKIFEKELDFQEMEIKHIIKEAESGNFQININKPGFKKQMNCQFMIVEDNILVYVIDKI
jgi:4'-phosphopantetheinyl transferase